MKAARSFALSGVLLLTACYDPDDHIVPQDIGDEFRLAFSSNDSLAADGVSTRRLAVYVPQQASAEGRKIAFATSSGVFVESGTKALEATAEVDADSLTQKGLKDRIAKAALQAGLSPGRVTVSAKAAGVTREKALPLSRALPERIALTANSFFIQGGYQREVELVAIVSRAVGRPSLNSKVSFEAIDAAGLRLGRFRSLDDTSDEQGKCTVIYGLLDSTRTGQIRVIASGTYRGQRLADTTLLDIIN